MTAAADLHRIQAYLRVAAPRGRDHERIGPFLATFNRQSDNPYLNYAIPDDRAAPRRAHIDALVAAYTGRSRKPRLEYIPSIAPQVEPALLDAGFEVEARTPLMVYAGKTVTINEPEGFGVATATSDLDLRDASAVQWEVYGESGPMPPSAVDGLRRTIEAGGIVVLARAAATREPAGAGLCTGSHDRTTELAAVGVREQFRRRGIAAAMTRLLTAEAIVRGIDNVFLMAEGEAEERIYARVGFETISEVLHISLTSA
jgi:ribosomal protein S18 acetylase RimI-like enzyme